MKRVFTTKILGAGAVPLALALAVSSWSQPNTLTAEEAAAGYENLFNGTDPLSVKWYGVTGNSQTSFSFTNNPPASWIISTENDYKVIEVTSGGQNHLATRDTTYRNFDLKTDWKVPYQGNSGIFTRFLKIASWGGASGTEAQVVDVNHSDGQQALHRAGTAYDMYPLRTGTTNWFGATGTWNQFRIIAYENRVAHYGNGVKLLEYDMNSQDYASRYAISKYKNFPRYKEVHAGSFYLQHHGETGIKYRSMKVKKLTDASMNPWAPGSPYRKANADSLLDTLPHDLALYGTTPVRPDARALPGHGVTFSSGDQGILIRFETAADRIVEVRSLEGRLLERHRANGTDRFLLPREGAAGARLLSVSTADGARVFSGLIPTL